MRLAITLSSSFALLTTGCFMDHNMPPDPPLPVVVVDAAISGATLGDDCPSEGIDGDIDSGACAEGLPCPSFCQQSNVQLSITTREGEGGPLTWELIRVTLHDFETGEELQELAPREPRVWTEDDYSEWDELLPVPSTLSTTYDLEAPDWGVIGGRLTDLWSRGLQIRMLVEIEGDARTLTSGAVYRVSDIDT